MHTMNRRHFIALAANSLLLAGCVGNTATTAAGSGSAAEAAGSAAGSAAAVVVPPEAIAAGWTEEAWSDMYGMMHFMGYVDGGWDVDKYLESEAGQWYIANSANGFRRDLDHDDPEVNEKWAKKGIKRTYNAAANGMSEYTVFTSEDYDASKPYPVLYGMHMGGSNIMGGEGMGWVEAGIDNGYIVVIPSWAYTGDPEKDTEGATAAGEAAKAAGYDLSQPGQYETYIFRTSLDQVKANYNVDESRVFVAGISGGGNAAAYIGMNCPDIVAGVSPSTGAAFQTIDITTSDTAKYGMALLMGCGELDAEQRWPITKDPIELGDVTNISPLADRIEHVNNWHRAAGAVGGQETEESVKENAAGDEVSATTRFGIAFDKQWVDEYEGNYYMGDLFDANGDPRVRYMSIDDCPHSPAPEWATEVVSFFNHFSRDPQSHQIVFQA